MRIDLSVITIAAATLTATLFFTPIAGAELWAFDEADFEPNDWDGSATPFPPNSWNGFLGVLEAGTGTTFTGTITEPGWNAAEGWYSGDTDLVGFELPQGEVGMLTTGIVFSPDCDADSIYNFWYLGVRNGELLYLSDLCNWGYPDLADVTCPFETLSAFTVDDWDGFFLLVAGMSGEGTGYTIVLDWLTCTDDDGDGYFDSSCGGDDCDDTDPLIHPCISETPGNGVDEDCSGYDRLPHPHIDEIEPNDDPDDQAQDLGTLTPVDSVRVMANWCTPNDHDHYSIILPEDAALTQRIIVDNDVLFESCEAFHGSPDDSILLDLTPMDLDGDSISGPADYTLNIQLQSTIDADGDGYFSDLECGNDCDDTSALQHPCLVEASEDCGNSIDEDCSGYDLPCSSSVESEPNDSFDESYDFGTLSDGVSVAAKAVISPSHESNSLTSDHDFYRVSIPEEGTMSASLAFLCSDDLDLKIGVFRSGEILWIDGGSGSANREPETIDLDFYQVDEWRFPLTLYIAVSGTYVSSGDYNLEIAWTAACMDSDGDLHTASKPDHPMSTCMGDCDDTNPEVHPAHQEVYGNGIDDDCDERIDEACFVGILF